MNAKVSRYGLIFADDWNELEFKDLNKVLWQLQHEMMQAANRAVQLYWEFSGYASDYKKKCGSYPDKNQVIEDTGSSNIRSLVYRNIAKEYSKNNTGNISTLLQNVGKRYKQNEKDCYMGKRSVDSYRSTIPIYLKRDSIKISKHEADYYVGISLLSNKFKKELGLKDGSLVFRLNFGKSYSSRKIIDDILSGECNHTSSSLILKKGKWMLNLGYKYENNLDANWVDGRVMGIDLGIVKPFTYAFNDMGANDSVDGDEITKFRNQMQDDSNGRSVRYFI